MSKLYKQTERKLDYLYDICTLIVSSPDPLDKACTLDDLNHEINNMIKHFKNIRFEALDEAECIELKKLYKLFKRDFRK